MAHSSMHFGLGMLAGAAAGLPLLRKALRQQPSLNSAKWLLLAYAVGAIAVFPSLLGILGVPEYITSSWPMNIFVLHPLINRLKSGGKLVGEFLIIGCFFCQYSAMLYLLRRNLGKHGSQSL